MAKTTAPLLSMGASGQIGKTMVASKWKGINYTRRYVEPANPNSTEQQKTRGTFSYLNGVFKLGSANLVAPWNAYASGKPLTGRNAFTKFNLPEMRGNANQSGFVGSPGNGGAVPPASIALADGGTHHITVTLGVPAVPSGWTITDSIAVALKSADPNTSEDYTSYAAASGDDSGDVSILVVAGTFYVAGWFKMTKPDGSVAYGPSLGGNVVIA